MTGFAELCRTNGWGPGTRLVGDEGYGPTIIKITAIGESGILARVVNEKGRPIRGAMECNWHLNPRRNWQVAP